ncbi:O-antigen polymerase [Spirosoma linguale]|uniref:Oligosaccharide repeat unit polymerase n=1 Tax=Spirosoma linguale (strain ATCC 33905 / DSM 74 / LMG 10896 / Claus 1) TaxID=504472 RepID=D2QRK2_SPILD|nr:hypothetical protein Slin_4929 [Spirosoma linguale DSM 74]
MEINFDILPKLILFALLLVFAYLYIYKKYIYSVIDPLFIFAITIAFASVLVIQIVQNPLDIMHFFLCQLALWLGFFIGYKKLVITSDSEFTNHQFTDETLLRYVTYLLFCVYIISNLLIAYIKGFALFSEVPTEAKIANFQGGFGFFRKVNWGVGTFVSTSLIFMYLRSKKIINFLLLLIVVFFTALEGSKSAILVIIISAGFILYHPAFHDDRKIIKKFQRFLPISLIGVMGVFFTVLMKENNSFDESIIAFFRRLLYSGDSVIYYYIPVNIEYFSHFSPFDYVSRVTNPILGLFRIQEYKEALGNIMVENLRPPNFTGGVTVGPNTPYYIEGRIYFGFWGALPYSALIGYIYAMIRVHYFSIVKSSSFYFVIISSFCHLISALFTDVNLAITQSFDLFLFVIPAYIVVSLAFTRKIVIKPTFLMSRAKSGFKNDSN